MDFVPNHEFMIINAKSSKFFKCLITMHKRGVRLLETGFLACPTTMSGPS
jgi:hypothetical protein